MYYYCYKWRPGNLARGHLSPMYTGLSCGNLRKRVVQIPSHTDALLILTHLHDEIHEFKKSMYTYQGVPVPVTPSIVEHTNSFSDTTPYSREWTL